MSDKTQQFFGLFLYTEHMFALIVAHNGVTNKWQIWPTPIASIVNCVHSEIVLKDKKSLTCAWTEAITRVGFKNEGLCLALKWLGLWLVFKKRIYKCN